jgi:hypothetical protein
MLSVSPSIFLSLQRRSGCKHDQSPYFWGIMGGACMATETLSNLGDSGVESVLWGL